MTAIVVSLLLASESPVADQLIAHLKAGEFEQATSAFDAKMKAGLGPEKLASVWAGLQQQLGALQKTGPARVSGSTVLMRCEFAKGALDLKLSLDDSQHIRGLFFVPASDEPAFEWHAPSYADATRFIAVPMKVGVAPQLDGELTLPTTVKPAPVVLLVHGSGPNDLDETLGATKLFKDLAQGLASKGIAVVRYEKRSRQHPESLAALGPKLTVKEEVIDDAVQGLEALSHDARFDSKRIFVAGHSLGAELVPRILARAPFAAGGIAMAARARPFGDLVVEQVGVVSKDPAQLEAARQFKQAVERKDLKPTDEVDLLGAKTSGAYWLDLRTPPTESVKGVKAPLLFIQGGHDYQVTMADFALWQKALAKRPATTFKSFPSLTHVLVEGEAGPGAYEKPGHVSVEVIDAVSGWVQAVK